MSEPPSSEERGIPTAHPKPPAALGRGRRPKRRGAPAVRTSAGALIALWLLVLLYSGYASALSIAQHDALQTHKADLGHFDQPVWNTLHGRLLVRTQQGEQLTRLTDHVEPILVPMSLVFLLWDDVRALLVLQAVAVALGALPVFWLARDELQRAGLSRRGREAVALVLVCAYLLFPALEAANLTEFHAAPFVVAPMLLALYYARHERFGPMWLAALAVMAVKEEMPLLTLMLGLWLLVFRRQWAHGAGLAAASLAWFGIATFVIVPHFAPLKYGVEESVYFLRYGELGDSPFAVARALVTRPALVWRIATEPARLHYLWGLLLSAGVVLPLLAPEILLLSLPSLLANLLSGYEAMYSGAYHYSAPVVPFVVAAAAVGLGRVARGAARLATLPSRPARDSGRESRAEPGAAPGDGSRLGEAAALCAAALLLATSLAYHRQAGYSPLSQGFAWPQVTDHHRLLEQRFAPQIPAGAVLSTTAPLFPHVDHRERIHQFPIVEDATWILLDAGSFPEMNPADLRREYDALIAGGTWCIVDAADGYVLLAQRGGVAGAAEGSCLRELPDAFFDFARVDDPRPQYAVDAEMGPLRLLGYDILETPQWQRVGVRLYWTLVDGQVQAPAGVRPSLFWLGPGGQMVETSEQRPLIEPNWYPPERWRPGEVVVTEMLPWDIGREFRLGVAVAGPGGERLPVRLASEGEAGAYAMEGGSWLRLQAFRWQGEMPRGEVVSVDERAPLPGSARAIFGGQIALSGWELLPESPRPGEGLQLRLSWTRAAERIDRDYTLFVHLLDGAGEGVAQADGMPNYLGELPTTLWRPGVPVLDERVLWLPADLAPGSYRLSIGWYDLQTGERLSLAPQGSGDSLELAVVQVR